MENGKKETNFCLKCHAPTVLFTKDFGLEQDVTREGITCDFCHTISDVNLMNQEKPYKITIGKVKRGPIKKAESPAHHAESSELHTKSEFCAGCHELKGKNGVSILGTYSEWKESPYAKEGIQCQDCHMPRIPGRVVKPDIKRSEEMVNLHYLQGGHSPDQVAKACKVEIKEVKRTGGKIYFRKRKIFKKILQNERRENLEKDYELLTKASILASDNWCISSGNAC